MKLDYTNNFYEFSPIALKRKLIISIDPTKNSVSVYRVSGSAFTFSINFLIISTHLSNIGLLNGSLSGPSAYTTDSKHSKSGNIILLSSSVSIYFLLRTGISYEIIFSFLMFSPRDKAIYPIASSKRTIAFPL